MLFNVALLLLFSEQVMEKSKFKIEKKVRHMKNTYHQLEYN